MRKDVDAPFLRKNVRVVGEACAEMSGRITPKTSTVTRILIDAAAQWRRSVPEPAERVVMFSVRQIATMSRLKSATKL